MEKEIQERASKLVQTEVICNVGGLIEELSNKTDGQYILDNFNPDPIDEKVHERMQENGVKDLPELNGSGNFDSDELEENAELLQAYEKAYAELRDEWQPLEYWAVTEWLAGQLGERGEVVAQIRDMHIWARGTSGQALKADTVMGEIARDTAPQEGTQASEMQTFEAHCGEEVYTFEAVDETDARHWVINHLDTSKEWTIYKPAGAVPVK